ncbi:hypothetical protein NQ317_004290 [Molorchus minor]|uniref:Peptidase S1 domain-containing protein n=1 Tax=Molorchus minor TaxID=1323400 RepID=A0ABQ9JFP5_9CUCU|nr:hypothetical protein NQ317_004290 [Molorchus minor]
MLTGWTVGSAIIINMVTASFVQVILGAHNIRETEATQVVITSSNIINHENYIASTLTNDVSLVRLPQAVTLSGVIQTISLAPGTSGTFAGSVATLSGWGRTADSISTISPVLQEINLSVVTNAVCAATYGTIIRDSTICTSGIGSVGACNGDSGGPLAVNGIQIGVTSFVSARGCESGLPSGFGRVSEFRTWISQNAGIIQVLGILQVIIITDLNINFPSCSKKDHSLRLRYAFMCLKSNLGLSTNYQYNNIVYNRLDHEKCVFAWCAILGCAFALPTKPTLDWSKIHPLDAFVEPINDISGPTGRGCRGTEAEPNSHPYQAAVIIDGSGFCGGSLISTNWILTAAHCTISASYVQVILGAHSVRDLEPTQVVLTSTNIINHSGHIGSTLTNDVALILLPFTVTLSDEIRPLTGSSIFWNVRRIDSSSKRMGSHIRGLQRNFSDSAKSYS